MHFCSDELTALLMALPGAMLAWTWIRTKYNNLRSKHQNSNAKR